MTLHAHPETIFSATAIPKGGTIALVGAGPGARDLLTLRALDRLRAADVIFYDRLVDPDILGLANPRATTVYVGKEVGAHVWTQTRISAAIVAAARRGLRVVRLKSGDPSLFGRAAEELAAAHDASIPVEIIPGITAASAAAASLSMPLTERGLVDRVVLATGTHLSGEAVANLSASLAPGTRLVLYMAIQHLDRIEAQLLSAGLAGTTSVEMVAAVSTSSEQRLTCTLSGMAAAAKTSGIRNPAVVFVTFPAFAAVEPAERAVSLAHSG